MNFVLLNDFMTDLVTVISHRQALDLNSQRLSSYFYKTQWLRELATIVLLTFVSKNRGKLTELQCFMFNLTRADFSHKNVLTIKIDFCFPKLYFSLLIWTQMKCINKQLLRDVNWLYKCMSKSTWNKTILNVLLCQKTQDSPHFRSQFHFL